MTNYPIVAGSVDAVLNSADLIADLGYKEVGLFCQNGVEFIVGSKDDGTRQLVLDSNDCLIEGEILIQSHYRRLDAKFLGNYDIKEVDDVVALPAPTAVTETVISEETFSSVEDLFTNPSQPKEEPKMEQTTEQPKAVKPNFVDLVIMPGVTKIMEAFHMKVCTA